MDGLYLRQVAIVFWKRWLTAAGRVLPTRLLFPGAAAKWSFEIQEDELERDGVTVAGKRVDVLLHVSNWIDREVLVPAHALKKANEVLRFQSSVTSGLPMEEVACRYLPLRNEPGGRRFVEVIAKQGRVDALQDSAARHGSRVRSIAVDHPSAGRLYIFDNRRTEDRPIWFWWGTGVSLLLLAAFAWITDMRQELTATNERILALQANNGLVQRELVQAEMSAQDQEARNRGLSETLIAFASGQSHAVELANITLSIPDEAWVTELAVAQNRVRLAGFFGGDVIGLMEELRVVEGVSGIELSAPVRADRQRGVSRFEFSWNREATQ